MMKYDEDDDKNVTMMTVITRVMMTITGEVVGSNPTTPTFAS